MHYGMWSTSDAGSATSAVSLPTSRSPRAARDPACVGKAPSEGTRGRGTLRYRKASSGSHTIRDSAPSLGAPNLGAPRPNADSLVEEHQRRAGPVLPEFHWILEAEPLVKVDTFLLR